MAESYQQWVAQQQQQRNYEAAWDQDRLQQQAQDRVHDLQYTREQLQQARQERDDAAARGDWEEARLRNADVGMWQQQEQELLPPPNPLSQHDIAFLQRKRAFLEKHGQAGLNAIALAHQRAVMPRNPHATSATDPMSYGHGLRQGTPAYYRAVEKELEVNGHLVGVDYDPSADALDWKGAARVSGIDQKTYADAYRTLKAAGRVS